MENKTDHGRKQRKPAGGAPKKLTPPTDRKFNPRIEQIDYDAEKFYAYESQKSHH